MTDILRARAVALLAELDDMPPDLVKVADILERVAAFCRDAAAAGLTVADIEGMR